MNLNNSQLYQQLKNFVLKRVKDLQDAEDIVQDVFMKAQLKNHQLKEAEKFTAWMFTLTRNSIMDFYREKKKILEPPLVSETEDYNEFNDCIFTCIDQQITTLPSAYREAFELSEKENISQKELATRLGISYSGAKSRVQRARQMLKDRLETIYHVKTDGFGNVLTCESKDCGCE